MTNLNMLETLRTKEELVNYFKAIGKNITEEKIEGLKKSYEQTEASDGALNIQQLNDVAGGIIPPEVRVKVHKLYCELSPQGQKTLMNYPYENPNAQHFFNTTLEDANIQGDNKFERAFHIAIDESKSKEDRTLALSFIALNGEPLSSGFSGAFFSLCHQKATGHFLSRVRAANIVNPYDLKDPSTQEEYEWPEY